MHTFFKKNLLGYTGIQSVQSVSKEYLIPFLGEATELIDQIKNDDAFKAKSGTLICEDYKTECVVLVLHQKLAVFFKEEMATVEVKRETSQAKPKAPKKLKIAIVPVLKIKKGAPIVKNKIRLTKICCRNCTATCPLLKPKQCDCKLQCPNCEGGMIISDVLTMFDGFVDRM